MLLALFANIYDNYLNSLESFTYSCLLFVFHLAPFVFFDCCTSVFNILKFAFDRKNAFSFSLTVALFCLLVQYFVIR